MRSKGHQQEQGKESVYFTVSGARCMYTQFQDKQIVEIIHKGQSVWMPYLELKQVIEAGKQFFEEGGLQWP